MSPPKPSLQPALPLCCGAKRAERSRHSATLPELLRLVEDDLTPFAHPPAVQAGWEQSGRAATAQVQLWVAERLDEQRPKDGTAPLKHSDRLSHLRQVPGEARLFFTCAITFLQLGWAVSSPCTAPRATADFPCCFPSLCESLPDISSCSPAPFLKVSLNSTRVQQRRI